MLWTFFRWYRTCLLSPQDCKWEKILNWSIWLIHIYIIVLRPWFSAFYLNVGKINFKILTLQIAFIFGISDIGEALECVRYTKSASWNNIFKINRTLLLSLILDLVMYFIYYCRDVFLVFRTEYVREFKGLKKGTQLQQSIWFQKWLFQVLGELHVDAFQMHLLHIYNRTKHSHPIKEIISIISLLYI